VSQRRGSRASGLLRCPENTNANSVITARKKVTGPDGRVIMFMDMSLKGITPKTFEILAAGLTKK
jgi:hypothetical protein